MEASELRQELETLIMKTIPKMIFIGEVASVNTEKGTCTVTPVDGRPAYTGVLIRPLKDGGTTGDFVVPTEGSQVVCCLIDNGQRCALLMVSEGTLKRVETEKIELKAAEVTVDADQFDFNGGQNGGLVKVDALVTRLNALENLVNTFVAIYSAHTHVATSLGAPTATPVAPMTQTATVTTKAQLENTKVKH